MPIIIEMTDNDFDHLVNPALLWAGQGWEDQGDRFINHTTADRERATKSTWKYIYWVIGEWSNVVLVRAYLASKGHDCEILYDSAGHIEDTWALLTDYESEFTRSDPPMTSDEMEAAAPRDREYPEPEPVGEPDLHISELTGQPLPVLVPGSETSELGVPVRIHGAEMLMVLPWSVAHALAHAIEHGHLPVHTNGDLTPGSDG